jgi:hypothetical protein
MPKTAGSKKPPVSVPPPQTRAQQQAIRRQMDETRQATRAQVQARREAQAAAARAARLRRRIITSVGAGLVVVLVVGGLVFWYSYTHPGESYPDQGHTHVASATAAHEPYTTDPPTSGPHLDGLAAWGVSDKTLNPVEYVHNMEDGGVIVQYRPDLPAADVERLKAIVKSYDNIYVSMRLPNGNTTQINQHVLMVPYPTLKEPVVLTAWTHMQRFPTLDENGIRHFIDMYRGVDHHIGGQG